ncbi:hypothetical protein B9Z55_025682 [Caenorhabditis nigoni]|uniref:Uncharacterized protein n=1 Tax=Caenorhabditis nigoni TaxID=1611254 RepID=A0A2G5T068_9PELO|nr:hypothetical protein B9Z55_025682 [Caenorhabditis nigoni]
MFFLVMDKIDQNSLKAAYSPMVSGECSKCGGVAQQTIKVEAQQAEYHFTMISDQIWISNRRVRCRCLGINGGSEDPRRGTFRFLGTSVGPLASG